MAGLGDIPVAGVLRAENYDRAKKFYTEVLGLKAQESTTEVTQEGMFEAGNGTMVMIYERPGMPAPENTTLGFGMSAERFDAIVGELRAKGVVFEEYDLPEIGLKTVNGVAEFGDNKAAWFKDSEDNIINLTTM